MASHKVLVIDDSLVIRRTVRDMLSKHDKIQFDIDEAKDGVQGMEKIHNGNPHVIMLDFFLPRKSGLEVYQEIQNDSHLKMIPLLLMSGRKDEVTDKILEPFEFFAFLEKPFDQQQLIQGINEAIKKSQIRRERENESEEVEESENILNLKAEIKQSNMKVGKMEKEILHLNTKVVKMEREILHVKSQLNKLVHFIKQRMK
jgi:DNA-binding NtrC family response regulator